MIINNSQQNKQTFHSNPFEKRAALIKEVQAKPLRKIEGLSFEMAASGFEHILKALTGKQELNYKKGTKDILGHIVYYLINDESSDYDLRKGLFFFGNTGTGKTTLLKACSEFTRTTRVKAFKIRSAKEVVNNILSDGNAKSLENYTQITEPYNFGFDDVGHENECTIFGTRINAIEEILTARYDRKLLTHCTSNLTPDRIKEYYGQRLHSRLHEMFNIILINGEDFRITNSTKTQKP